MPRSKELQDRIRKTQSRSVDIHGKTLEVSERAMSKCTLMGGPQRHTRCLARIKCLLPARSAQAPAITGLQTRKPEFGDRSREIVAAGFRERKKSQGHDCTDRVTAAIFATRVAAPVAEETSHWLQRADLEPLAEHIAGIRPPAAAACIVPQHHRFVHSA